MKKTLLFLGCLSLLAAGCNKVETVEEPEEVFPELKFNITANFDNETRAVKRDWAEGDKIYLAFDVSFQDEVAGFPTNHGYVTLTYDGSAFSNPAFSDPAFSKALQNAPEGKLAAAYVSGGNPQFQFEELSGGGSYALSVANRDELGGCILSASAVGYTISDNTLTADLDLTLEAREGSNRLPVHFFLPSVSEDNASNFTLSCTEFFPDSFACFLYIPLLSDSYPAVPRAGAQNSDYGKPIRGSYYDGGIEFVAMLNPAVNGVKTDYTLVITDNQGTPDDDSDDVVYTIPKIATLKGKEAFNLPALTSPRWSTSNVSGTRGTLNGHDWVLMADGNKWATLNVGAEEEVDGGLSIKWTEAQDELDRLWGKGWRLASVIEWVHLMSNVNHSYRADYYDNLNLTAAFRGWEITVNDDPDLEMAGNRLFIPNCPYVNENNVPGGGYQGYYWTSSLYDQTHPEVWNFDERINSYVLHGYSVNCQMCVRAVVDETLIHTAVEFHGFNDEIQW